MRQPDLADDALVTVMLAPDHIDLAPEDQIREVLFGSLSEGLFLFRRVNAGEPDLELLATGIQHGDGVSVADADADADDFAGQGVGKGCSLAQRQGATQNDGKKMIAMDEHRQTIRAQDTIAPRVAGDSMLACGVAVL